MTHYEDHRSIKIADTKNGAVEFLKLNPSSDIFLYDDDGREIEVTRDLRDEIIAAEEAAKSETEVLREAVALLQKQITALSNRVDAMEKSND